MSIIVFLVILLQYQYFTNIIQTMNSLFSTKIGVVWFIDQRYDRFVFNNSGNISGLLFGNMYCISSLPFVIHRNEACAFGYRSNYYYCCYYYLLYCSYSYYFVFCLLIVFVLVLLYIILLTILLLCIYWIISTIYNGNVYYMSWFIIP